MFKKIFIALLICIFANGEEVKFENDISNEVYKLARSDTFKKVYASNPVLLYHLYSFDKSRIVGLVFEFYESEKRFLDKNITSLPVVGGGFWTRQSAKYGDGLIAQTRPNTCKSVCKI